MKFDLVKNLSNAFGVSGFESEVREDYYRVCLVWVSLLIMGQWRTFWGINKEEMYHLKTYTSFEMNDVEN